MNGIKLIESGIPVKKVKIENEPKNVLKIKDPQNDTNVKRKRIWFEDKKLTEQEITNKDPVKIVWNYLQKT